MASILSQKSFEFALQVVRAGRAVQETQGDYILSRQLIRSGTAIGAMLAEAKYAESQADFIHKLKVALKEANECLYWIGLMTASELLDTEFQHNLTHRLREIIAMLVAAVNTLDKQNKKER